MAVAFSKQTAFTDTGTSNLNGKVTTFGQAITVNAASNELVLCVTAYDGANDAGSNVTPSGVATTWTKIADNVGNANGGRCQIWLGTGTLTSGTLTLTLSVSAWFGASCSEWSGLGTVVDSAICWGGSTAWGGAGSTGYTSATGTANQAITAPTAGSLIVHCANTAGDGTSFTYTSPTTAQTSLTGAVDVGLNCGLAAAYAIWGSSGSYSLGVPSGTPAASTLDGWSAVAIEPSGAVAPLIPRIRVQNRSALSRSARM